MDEVSGIGVWDVQAAGATLQSSHGSSLARMFFVFMFQLNHGGKSDLDFWIGFSFILYKITLHRTRRYTNSLTPRNFSVPQHISQQTERTKERNNKTTAFSQIPRSQSENGRHRSPSTLPWQELLKILDRTLTEVRSEGVPAVPVPRQASQTHPRTQTGPNTGHPERALPRLLVKVDLLAGDPELP